jgi:hypothetical protein
MFLFKSETTLVLLLKKMSKMSTSLIERQQWSPTLSVTTKMSNEMYNIIWIECLSGQSFPALNYKIMNDSCAIKISYNSTLDWHFI